MKEITEFITGLTSGLIVIFAEIQFFIANLIYNQVSTTLVTSQSESLFFGISFSLIIFSIWGIIQNFLIGYLRPIFAFGFFIGNLIIILFLGGSLFTTMPEVLCGLILVCASVLVGLFFPKTE